MQKVKNEKIVWIGPDIETIELMGDKINSKNFCKKRIFLHSAKNSKLSDAKKIGFPILVKASAGGGGKGMRIVNSDQKNLMTLLLQQKERQNQVLEITEFF